MSFTIVLHVEADADEKVETRVVTDAARFVSLLEGNGARVTRSTFTGETISVSDLHSEGQLSGQLGERPDDSAPGEQISGETADGETLPPVREEK